MTTNEVGVGMQLMSDVAKSPEGAYTLPTGHIDENGKLHRSVFVREMTGAEEDILASTSKMPMYQRMQKLLENCTTQIGDIKQDHPQWSRIIRGLTVSDRLFLIIRIRAVTLGELFTFRVKCPADECGKVSSQTVPLKDFKIEGLKNPTERVWSDEFPRCKKKFTARVQTGAEEELLDQIKAKSNDFLSLAMLARFVELDNHNPVTLDQVKSLPLADRTWIRKKFTDHEGTMDNDVEVTCPDCGHEFKTSIEIADSNFFFPTVT